MLLDLAFGRIWVSKMFPARPAVHEVFFTNLKSQQGLTLLGENLAVLVPIMDAQAVASVQKVIDRGSDISHARTFVQTLHVSGKGKTEDKAISVENPARL